MKTTIKGTFSSLFCIVATLTALSISPSSHAEEKKATTPTFAGLWNTSFGKLRLIESGDGTIRGCYRWEGNNGEVVGKLEKGAFAFNYKDMATGEGRFELSEDGMSFSGKWRQEGTEKWNEWNGKRIIPRPGLKMLVVIEARWESGLVSEEFSFGEMLDSYFKRVPHIAVRERFFTNYEGFAHWCRDIAYVAEPVVLSIASHGTKKAITVNGKQISADQIAEALKYAANLQLVQFSACSIMAEDAPKTIQDTLAKKGIRIPISGYARPVPWGASATLEFAYFSLLLEKSLKPAEAAKQLRLLMPHAGDTPIKGSVIPPMDFRFRPSPE